MVHHSVLRLALYFVLVSGFVLAALSLVLRCDKTLGTAMVVTLLGTMIGSLPAHRDIRNGVIAGSTSSSSTTTWCRRCSFSSSPI